MQRLGKDKRLIFFFYSCRQKPVVEDGKDNREFIISPHPSLQKRGIFEWLNSTKDLLLPIMTYFLARCIRLMNTTEGASGEYLKRVSWQT